MPENRTYRATTVTHALSQVKKDLGPDAVIVATRRFRTGSVLGVGGTPVVEIVASPPANTHAAPSPRASLAAMRDEVPTRRTKIDSPADPRPPALSVAVPATQATRPRSADRLRATPVRPAPTDPAALDALRDEMGAIRTMVGQLLRCSNSAAAAAGRDRAGFAEAAVFERGSLSEPLFAHYTRLVDAGVDAEVAYGVVAGAADDAGPTLAGDVRRVREAVLARLAGEIPCRRLFEPPLATGRAVVVALVGPTGVGKTTTIAKLAADHALRRGRKVSLVTTDTYRIGAVDQLRTYADIIGIPLAVAPTPGEAADAVRRASGSDLVFLDTAGRSPADDRRIDDLAELIEAVRPDHRLLVLAATTADVVLRRIIARFAALDPDGLVLSKLDEAPALGAIVNAPCRSSLPVALVTTGQDVPDCLADAVPERLAAAVLDGEIPT